MQTTTLANAGDSSSPVSEQREPNETVSNFLGRLKPSTDSPVNRRLRISSSKTYLSFDEPGEKNFKYYGENLLRLAKTPGNEIDSSEEDEEVMRLPHSTPTKVRNSLLTKAREKGITSGKWIIYVPRSRVDSIWEFVARGTAAGVLGCEASVLMMPAGEDPDIPIGVHTRDFYNAQDVARVLGVLLRAEVHKENVKRTVLYYKPDAFTCLGLHSGNEYKIKVSEYSCKKLKAQFPELTHV